VLILKAVLARTLLSSGGIFVLEKEKAGEGSRSQGADSYRGYDNREVTISQGKTVFGDRKSVYALE
jgi:hypothetical protein